MPHQACALNVRRGQGKNDTILPNTATETADSLAVTVSSKIGDGLTNIREQAWIESQVHIPSAGNLVIDWRRVSILNRYSSALATMITSNGSAINWLK